MQAGPTVRRARARARPAGFAAAWLVLSLASTAGAEPHGPQFGDNRFKTAIQDAAGGDVDQYVGDLLRGESITVVVKALKGSGLRPRLQLVDPSGTARALDARELRGGRVIKLTDYPVPSSGRWTVRTWGGDDSTGAYQISFKVRRRAKVAGRNERVGGPHPPSRTYEFPGFPGATVDVLLKSRKRGGVARLLAIRDPDGSDVTGVPTEAFRPPRSPRKPVRVRGLTLTGRAGTYTAVVGLPPQKAGDGSEAFDLRVTVRDPQRPRSRRAQDLTPAEPRIDRPPIALRGPPGTEIALTGTNFSVTPPTRVFFGDAEAQVVAATPTSLSAVAPPGENHTTVDLVAVNPDGQSDTLTQGFQYRAPEMLPGLGFTGPTPQPAAVGSGPGDDAQAIARWDCVPWQDVDTPFALGVVAFHINGIDRVEFSANDGPATVIDEMTLNPRTGVWEYWAELDPARFPDGLVEIRAVVYPKVGIARVLQGPIDLYPPAEHSMFLYANSRGTLQRDVRWCDSVNGSDTTGDGSEQNPFRQPLKALQDVDDDNGSGVGAAAGCIVYLKAGSYQWGPANSNYPDTSNRWATITAAPGVSRSEVVFDASTHPGFRTEMIRAKNMTFRSPAYFNTIGGSERRMLWLDGMHLDGPGHPSDYLFFLSGNWDCMWSTDTLVEGCRIGMKGVHFVRNNTIRDITDDAFVMARVVLNCTVDNIDQAQFSSFHTDVFQFAGTGDVENFVIFGLKATDCIAQLIFCDDLDRVDDVAFVNVVASKPTDDTTHLASQWKDPSTNHLLLYHVTLGTGDFLWRTGGTRENIAVVGSTFPAMFGGDAFNGRWRDNHYVDASFQGATPVLPGDTTGASGFADPDRQDFTPTPGSVLRERVTDLVVPIDVHGDPRTSPTSVGGIR